MAGCGSAGGTRALPHGGMRRLRQVAPVPMLALLLACQAGAPDGDAVAAATATADVADAVASREAVPDVAASRPAADVPPDDGEAPEAPAVEPPRVDADIDLHADAGQPAQTRAEEGLLVGNAVDAEALDAAFQSGEWDEYVDMFEEDALADPDARDLQRLYEDALRASLAGYEMALARFGCGLSLCAGTLRAPEPGAGERYAAWRTTFPGGSGLPAHVYADFPVAGDGLLEVRFVFSMDPAANAVMVRH